MGGGPAVYNSVGPGAPPLTFGKGPSAACSQVVLLHGLLWLPGTSMMFVALSLLPVLPFFLPHAAAPPCCGSSGLLNPVVFLAAFHLCVPSQYVPIDEQHSLKAVSPYGATKLMIEDILR